MGITSEKYSQTSRKVIVPSTEWVEREASEELHDGEPRRESIIVIVSTPVGLAFCRSYILLTPNSEVYKDRKGSFVKMVYNGRKVERRWRKNYTAQHLAVLAGQMAKDLENG